MSWASSAHCFFISRHTEWVKREEAEVVGWLLGQRVTSGCPGAQKREVSCGRGQQHMWNTGSAHLTSPTAMSFFCTFAHTHKDDHLFLICNILKWFSSPFPSLASPFFSLSSLWSRTRWEGVCWHSCTVCFALDRALAPVHIPSLPSLASLTPTPPPPH